MFSERMNRFRRSLAFRLMLLYTATFTLSSFVAFIIFYEVVIFRIHARVDSALVLEVKELSSILISKGISSFKEAIILETESEGTDDVFFRLLTNDGEEITSSDLVPWEGIGISRIALNQLVDKKTIFETLKPPNRKHKVRVLYSTVDPGMVLQIGQSLREEEKLFEEFRKIFGTAIVVVLCLGTLGGWLMARRALSGVERITQTAMAISDGAMEKRVPVTGKGDEIDRLSSIFNQMLDRIHFLITEMKEVIDNIAHDLRSPITRIRGLAEVTLTNGKYLDEYQTMAAGTVEECDRLTRMINTMLEISEAEAGVSALAKSEVDISSLVKEGTDLFQPLAENKSVHIEVHTPSQCLFYGDRGKLQRMLANLLDNAIKYTPSGGRIFVSARKGDHDVMISVQDTGIGISPKDISHIFNRFYRVDKSRSEAGAGLGLSLVGVIARSHGGEVRVNSSPGVGSTFTVVLPTSKSK